jgi:F-type H+-transporting ATPase subunit b
MSPGQQIVRESREAAGEEDDKAQFKRSAAVRFLAKMTGSVESAYWLSVLFNFAVIAAVIGWFSRKSLPGMFRDRTASIRKAMDEAKRASEEANQRLSSIEQRLARLGDEIAQMRSAAETEAVAEEERVRAAAAEDARKIAEAAGVEIAAAGKAARRELTAYAADLAVSLATKQIRVDAATDQGLVRRFAEQLANRESGKGKN